MYDKTENLLVRRKTNRANVRAWTAANRIKRLAHDAVGRAVKKGILVRPNKCHRCNKECRPHAHHADYTKPLSVEWLCPKCHFAEGKQVLSGRRTRHGEESPQHKLSNDQVLDIRALYDAGLISMNALSRQYRTSESNIRAIVKRQTWKHI